MAPPQQRSLVRSSGTAFLQAKAEFPTLDVHPTHGRPFSKPHPWKEPLAVSVFVCAWFLVDTARGPIAPGTLVGFNAQVP